MRTREARRNVMIKARMRAGTSWNDALILNLSSRGMMVRADQSPDRGSYLEIRRGPHVMVARVVWSKPGRFGVQTQDLVPADNLIGGSEEVNAHAKPGCAGFQERRATPRPAAARHEGSRQRARAAEFGGIALVCGNAAMLMGSAIFEVVALPLGASQAALAGK